MTRFTQFILVAFVLTVPAKVFADSQETSQILLAEFDWNRVLIMAVIGGIVGGVAAFIGKKKKKDDE